MMIALFMMVIPLYGLLMVSAGVDDRATCVALQKTPLRSGAAPARSPLPQPRSGSVPEGASPPAAAHRSTAHTLALPCFSTKLRVHPLFSGTLPDLVDHNPPDDGMVEDDAPGDSREPDGVEGIMRQEPDEEHQRKRMEECGDDGQGEEFGRVGDVEVPVLGVVTGLLRLDHVMPVEFPDIEIPPRHDP